MDVETQVAVVAGVLGAAWLVLLIVVGVLFSQVRNLKKQLAEVQNSSRIKVQKLKMNNDKNHCFHNPALSPDEELSRRGFSMYMGQESQSDVESGRYNDRQPERHQERQTGGQFVEELMHELDNRQSRQQTNAPPFLLQSIQENKLKSRNQSNPITSSPARQSETNPNFIY